MQSRQISGYSADARDRLAGRSNAQCLAALNIASKDIHFATDKAIIRPESHRVLDEVGQILGSCAGTSFEIAGHTDSDASDAYNINLSQRRVNAVRRALAERGVDVTGYVARGYGESQPIASNATAAGKAQNRRVEFRPLENDVAHQNFGNCESTSIFNRELDADANQDGTNIDGAFLSDRHNCITDRREIFEGSISFMDTDQGQDQTALNLSYRREQYRGQDSVLGFFVGAYGSRSDVTSAATGTIDGLGLNAGLYGANRFHDDLFLDYYAGAATGRHDFDLAFERAIGTIEASGDYLYFAGFLGAAVSGKYEYGNATLTPRGGFDYVFAPSSDVDVLSELGAFSEVDALELDAIAGGRVFAEIDTTHPISDGSAKLSVTPRISCYQSLGSLDGVCGFGGSIGIASVDDDQDQSYAFELDGELGNDFFLGTASASLSQRMGPGLFSGDVSMNTQERVSVGATYGIDF
ncbi:OmpA family protein [Yoonia sp. I 8.24]|nr:OmpA family protein [Yoonia sp. I 8.24]